MSLADEMLTSLSDGESSNVVIGADRFITVPDNLKRIGVQHDHNIEKIIFDCPRYWDGHDLSEMQVYVNYIRSDEVMGAYPCMNVTVDTNDTTLMHFDWVISRHVTYCEGPIKFSVSIRKIDNDGALVSHWNSEINTDLYVSSGLKCEDTITEQYPDVISYLMGRLDYIEQLITTQEVN